MLQQEREVLGIDFAVAAVDARLEIASIDDSWSLGARWLEYYFQQGSQVAVQIKA